MASFFLSYVNRATRGLPSSPENSRYVVLYTSHDPNHLRTLLIMDNRPKQCDEIINTLSWEGKYSHTHTCASLDQIDLLPPPKPALYAVSKQRKKMMKSLETPKI